MGSGLAVLVAVASWTGGLKKQESDATDRVFLYGRRDPPPASNQILLALLDDQAIDTVGQWPWPRAIVADTLRRIDEFGARVVAIDVHIADRSNERDDQALEDALANMNAKVILAANPTASETRLGWAWRGSAGREAWATVIAALRKNIRLKDIALINALELGPVQAERVRERLGAYKRVAIRKQALALRAEGRLSLETLRASMLTEEDREIGEFPELRLMQAEVDRALAADVLERNLPRAEPDVSYAYADGLSPPLLRFARHAVAPGVVNAEPDGDGNMRRVALRWKIGTKVYPQLGAIAATVYRDDPLVTFAPKQMLFEGARGQVVVGSRNILLCWPEIDRGRGANVFANCSLGTLVELDRKRARQAEREAEQEKRTREFAKKYVEDAGPWDSREEMLEEIREQIDFMLEDVEGDEEEDEEAQRIARAATNWLRRDREIAERRKEVRATELQLRQMFEGKLVFYGWSATASVGDFYPTAIHPRTPGVVAHAVVANSLLQPYLVQPAPNWIGGLIALCLGLLSTTVTRSAGPRFSFLFATLLAVVYIAFHVLVVFNAWQVSMAIVAPLLSIYVAWAGTTTVRAIRERLEKAQLQRQFGARISPQLFDFLVNNPDLVHLEGEEREVTCFFSDLAGFTSISERLDSVETVRLLNRYMYEMNAELTEYSAYVNKFLGDGIMAVWGAFELGTPHAEQACLAAIGCRRKLEQLNASPELDGLPKLSMRIGIATGVVTLGDCGAPPDLRDYTVIGDTANLAARLESANKQFGTRILINGRTRELLPAFILTRPLGVVTVVGQKTPTEIHEVINVAGEATEGERQRIDQTTAAVEAYRTQRFDEAVDLWRELRRDPASELLAELYLAQIALYHGGTDLAFDGVLHLTKK
ncbi:MAG: CHASE2 domain-containing protein [Planctomycetota bacterium]